ncbi:hypothetical protein SAMN05421755_100257 [Nitrosomonas sp. Nm33]|nr:hypothetical protein SAMN05421755_100257 [Nitrosomonas sp. Nm33]
MTQERAADSINTVEKPTKSDLIWKWNKLLKYQRLTNRAFIFLITSDDRLVSVSGAEPEVERQKANVLRMYSFNG